MSLFGGSPRRKSTQIDEPKTPSGGVVPSSSRSWGSLPANAARAPVVHRKYQVMVIVPTQDHEALSQAQETVHDNFPPDFLVAVVNLLEGPALQDVASRYHIHRSVSGVLELIDTAQKDGYHGILISSLFETHYVSVAREVCALPILGTFFASASLALSISDSFSVILFGVEDAKAARVHLKEVARHYGMEQRVKHVAVIPQAKETSPESYAGSLRDIVSNTASSVYIVQGLSHEIIEMAKQLINGEAVLIDSLIAGLGMLSTSVRLNLKHRSAGYVTEKIVSN